MRTLRRSSLACFLVLVSLSACSSGDGGEQLPVNVIDFTDGGTAESCVQPSFPDSQPDLSIFNPPYFLLTTSRAQESTSGQAQVRPGDTIEAKIPVNSATRRVLVELTSVWDRSAPIATAELETNGNEMLDFIVVPEGAPRGRFYMRLTLCGADCREQQIVFETQSCADLPDSECGPNAPYVRSVIENGEVVRTDPTCVDLGDEPMIGSGTVLIQ